jgi:Putative transposase/Transposase zinc-binding domain
MHDMTGCRPAPLGGHSEQGPHCGFERSAYTSCRHRHCPKCQPLPRAQGGADRQAALLPVPYVHGVFTLAHGLNPLVLRPPRPRLTLLFQAVRQTLLQFGRQNLGGQMGGTMVVHTWAQTLGAHFHLHCLIPAGALSHDGTQWLPTAPRFLFPVQALSPVFRGKFLEALRQLRTTGAVRLPGETATLETPADGKQWWDQLYRQAWVVYVKPSLAGPAQTLDYRGRYTHRGAISNNRIVEVRDGQGRCTYRNRRQGHQGQPMVLEAPEFIRRFLRHILPQGLQRMRPIGFLANRCKARALRQCRQLLGQSADPPPRGQKTVVEWRRQFTGTAITRCPACGYRPLHRTPLPARLLRPGRPLPLRILDSS